MSSTSRQAGVRVAASLVTSDGKNKEWSNISRSKLIKITRQHKAKYLGTDNPTEILFNGESIDSFCSLLPTQCNFVHINLTKTGSTVSLNKLLMQYNINTKWKKLSPVLTARAIVKLIQMGVGMKLEPFENETIIEIGKPRRSGKGGWSQSRYERQGEEIVARASKIVRLTLEKSKLPFDQITRSTKYGAKQSRFHVFTYRTKVIRIIKSLSLYPAKIKIWSPKKSVITQKPITYDERKHRAQFHNHIQRLIVGIDPGMTTGVAALDLNGKVVTVFSRKNLSKGNLVSDLSNYGIPVMVCSDVYPVPTFVNKLASTYNAEISFPTTQLTQEEKRQLANQVDLNTKIDSHGRDALSAVMMSYNKLKPHFNKLEKEVLTRKEKDLAKGLIIRGISTTDSISAVKMLRKSSDPPEIEVINQETLSTELPGRLYNLLYDMATSEETITNLRAHTGRLEAKLNQYEYRNKQLAWQLSQSRNEIMRELLKTEMIEEKDLEIKMIRKSIIKTEAEKLQLQELNSSLEHLIWASLEEGGIPIKILLIFSNDAIFKLKKEKGINPGDIILIVDPSGGGPQTALKLTEVKLRMVFLQDHNLTEDVLNIFYDRDIPVIRSENYDIRRIGQLALINPENFEKALNDYQIQYELRKAEERASSINLEIENYQYEREIALIESKKDYNDFEPEEVEDVIDPHF